MANEFEELQITVNLTDNASTGLRKINDEIDQMGGGDALKQFHGHIAKTGELTKSLQEEFKKLAGHDWGRAFEILTKGSKDLTLGLKPLGEGMEAMTGRLGGLTKGFGILGTAIAAIGLGAREAYKQFDSFTTKIEEIKVAADALGAIPAQYQRTVREMEAAGLSAEKAKRNIESAAADLANLARPNSSLMNDFLRGAGIGVAQREAMAKRLVAIEKTDIVGFLNWFKELEDAASTNRYNAMKNARDSSGARMYTEEQAKTSAAEVRRELETTAKLVDIWRVRRELTRTTPAENKKFDEDAEASEKFQQRSRDMAESWKKLDDAAGRFFAHFSNPVANATVTALTGLADELTKMFKGHEKYVEDEKELLRLRHESLAGGGPRNEREAPRQPNVPGRSRYPRQGFQHGGEFMVGGSGGTDSQHINFMATPGERVMIHTPEQQKPYAGETVREQIKTEKQLTDELKRLNDFLMLQRMLDQGGAGKGGSDPTGAGGGGGGGGMRGLGGIPGLGGSRGGGGGSRGGGGGNGDAPQTPQGPPPKVDPSGEPGAPQGTPSKVDPSGEGAAAAPPAVPAAGGGGGGGGGGGPNANLAGDRKRFADELAAKPWLREKILAIGAGENQNPQANQSVFESMMNRASVAGHSLEKEARLHASSGHPEGGYYAGYNPGALKDAKFRAESDARLNAALGGSNVSNYATDNSSGGLAQREKSSKRFVLQSEYGGSGGTGSRGMESFFSPGTGGNFPRSQWQSWRDKMASGAGAGGAQQPAAQPHVEGGQSQPATPGAQSSSTVPAGVLAQARQAAALGPGAVKDFMQKAGYPQHDNWCGDFAASVLKQSGHPELVPKDPWVASNWRKVGPEVTDPQPGDIAVRRAEHHGRLGTGQTGDTGSHVTVYGGVGSDKTRFTGIGGNQGRGGMVNPNMPLSQYQFYRPGGGRGTGAGAAAATPNYTPVPLSQTYSPVGARAQEEAQRAVGPQSAAEPANAPTDVSSARRVRRGANSEVPAGQSEPAAPGAQSDSTLPAHIHAQAQEIAMQEGAPGVSKFLAQQGFPKHDNWCGDFAAAVVKKAGGVPPDKPWVASNWRNWGHEVTDPQPGDIAVKRMSRSGRHGYVPTGQGGSHVTTVGGVGEGGKFTGVGGNQGEGRMTNPDYNIKDFQFYRANDLKKKAEAETGGDGDDGGMTDFSSARRMVRGAQASGGLPGGRPIIIPGHGGPILIQASRGSSIRLQNETGSDPTRGRGTDPTGAKGDPTRPGLGNSDPMGSASRDGGGSDPTAGRPGLGNSDPMGSAARDDPTHGAGSDPTADLRRMAGRRPAQGNSDPTNMLEIDRANIDRATTHRVEGTGKISVDVNAPRGTRVRASSGGLFKSVSVARQTQMEKAASSLRSAGRGGEDEPAGRGAG